MIDQWQHIHEARGLVKEIIDTISPPQLGQINYKAATLDQHSILLIAFGQDHEAKQFLIIRRPPL